MKKNSPKEASALFYSTIKANAKTVDKSKKDNWMLVDAPASHPIPLSENMLFHYGFQKIKPNTYLLDGIEIVREGKKFNYKKEQIKTVQEMKIIFLDAGKEMPEAIDPSWY